MIDWGMNEKQLGELLKVVIGLYARQLATQDLLRQLGATKEQLDRSLQKAKERLSRVPRLAYLSNPKPTDVLGLAALLESIRWPEA